MLFNSYIFILFFLPLTLGVYFGLNQLGKENMAKWALIGFSLWFYAYFHVSYLFLIVGSILFNFFYSKILCWQSWGIRGKTLLTFGIAVNLGLIFYFKYFNFFVDNLNMLFRIDYHVGRILMPLGISFFTFQQVSYLVDSYRGETADYKMAEYALFVTFFPQLIAGPIVLHSEMIPQFRDSSRKKVSQEKLAYGIYLFAIGLFKKVMIADSLARGADWGFANPEMLTAPEVLIVSVLYTLQLYFDFSGYCDMAVGIANMFHFELPINFNSPYKATTIHDFWQRWHMTLTRFLRKYVYFPLGGSKKGKVRMLINTIIVFLVSGIWHGAGWTFILWGISCGIGSVFYHLTRKFWDRMPKVLGWAFTFGFFNLTCIVFRAESLKTATIFYRKLMNPMEWKLGWSALAEQFDLLEFTYVEDHVSFLKEFVGKFPLTHMVICLAVGLFLALIPRNCHEKKFIPGAGNALVTIILLFWSIVSLSGLTIFLYFNF